MMSEKTGRIKVSSRLITAYLKYKDDIDYDFRLTKDIFINKIHFNNNLQLGTGESFNVTLNLSGLILLGLGLSTALLAYMFLDAFKDDGKDSYHSGYGYDSYGYDTSGSGGYGHHRKGDFNRKSRKGKVKKNVLQNIPNFVFRNFCLIFL